jgi:hypothetical protein
MAFLEFQRRDSIYKIVELIHAGAGRDKPPDILVEHWHYALSDFTDDQIKYGYEQISKKTGTWIPSTGDFIEAMQTAPGCLTFSEEAERYWKSVLKIIKLRGAYHSLWCKNAVVSETIRQLGSWIHLCSTMNSKDETWHGKEFCRIYVSTKRQNIEFDNLLLGIFDGQNRNLIAAGQASPNILFLGKYTEDEQKSIISQVTLRITNESRVAGLITDNTNKEQNEKRTDR